MIAKTKYISAGGNKVLINKKMYSLTQLFQLKDRMDI